MLPSLSGLSLHDEEPTGALDSLASEIKKRQKAKEKEALRQLLGDRERDEAAARRAAEEERDEAVTARDREAAARLAAEQARDQAQQNVQALDRVRALQQLVIDQGERNRNLQGQVIQDASRANESLVSRVRDAEARQAYAQEKLRRMPSPQRTPVRDNDAAPQPDLPPPGQYDSQGTDNGDAPMAADNGAAPMEMEEDPDALPPYRGDTSLLRPSTSDRIEELRRHLLTDPSPANPEKAKPDFTDVLPMGFERLMNYDFIKRGTEEKRGTKEKKDVRPKQSPATVQQTMLKDRLKAWEAFIVARNAVLKSEKEMRMLQTRGGTSNIPLEKVRWDTKTYLKGGIINYAASEKGGKRDGLKYFKDAQTYPAIKADLYKALQKRQSTDGKTIFVRTEKVQAVYEAALAFCQADLKYEVTLARRRTWVALYEFLEARMMEKWDPNEPEHTREFLWTHAIQEAREKLPCFPPDTNTFERLQKLMEAQVTNNIQWQYPYYNAYELSRDDGFLGEEFKFDISRGPTMSLVEDETVPDQRTYYIQHIHIPWEWMKVFLHDKATNLARGLGDFCGSRFLVDKKYEEAKETHDAIKPDAPKALQTRPDPRIKKTAPLSMKENRRLDSDLSNRGIDNASRGAQLTLGTMHSNYHTLSAEPLSIDRNRRFGSMQAEDYEFYDPYLEKFGKAWKPPANWQPPEEWRKDIETPLRRRTFLRMHKKYWAYTEHQVYAKTFIDALEASEEALYAQAWNERLLVGELLDPNGCLRDTPKRKAFAFSLTSGFSVAPHDDSGAALEHIVFTYPAHTELPLGHNPMFVASGIIMMLPGPADKGPPGNELAGIRACLCTVPGHGVHHGSMPTWTAEFYEAAEKADKLATLTLPKHFKCGSALITKVVPSMVAQRVDKNGNLTEFTDCQGLITVLDPDFKNDKNMEVTKLVQLLYKGNEPTGLEDLSTKGKVWSFDVRTQWLASYPTKDLRNEMKALMLKAYRDYYKLNHEQFEELQEQERQREQRQREAEEARKAEEAEDSAREQVQLRVYKEILKELSEDPTLIDDSGQKSARYHQLRHEAAAAADQLLSRYQMRVYKEILKELREDPTLIDDSGQKSASFWRVAAAAVEIVLEG